MGTGTALVKAVLSVASGNHCRRVWLVTTNDNTGAIEFYRKTGFSLAAIHRDAIAESGKLKPVIPETGYGGTPIKDEIEFEILLGIF